MRNYFNTKHIDAIEIEEVADLLHHTDMKADVNWLIQKLHTHLLPNVTYS